MIDNNHNFNRYTTFAEAITVINYKMFRYANI